jgi:hypothetical protein
MGRSDSVLGRRGMRGKQLCDEIVRLIDDVLREADISPQERDCRWDAKEWRIRTASSHRAGTDDMEELSAWPSPILVGMALAALPLEGTP